MLNSMSIQEFFAQLYAHADLEHEPSTGGRSMNAHFGSRYIKSDGSWRNQMEMYNAAVWISRLNGAGRPASRSRISLNAEA